MWTASNHDVGRFPTRWCRGDERKVRLALLVLATLPGTTVLYYGDEIGMADVAVPPELRQDKMTRDGALAQGNRDRARTPMHWDASQSGGFTADGVKPWLPVGDAAARNVADQRRDPDSVLSFCRRLLALRRAELAGQVAEYEPGGGRGTVGPPRRRPYRYGEFLRRACRPARPPWKVRSCWSTAGDPSLTTARSSGRGRASSRAEHLDAQRADVAVVESVLGQPRQHTAVPRVDLIEERGHGLGPRHVVVGGRLVDVGGVCPGCAQPVQDRDHALAVAV